MKRSMIVLSISTILCLAGTAHALETSLAGYATYWNADRAGDGVGVGLRLQKVLVGMLAADASGGYVDFTNSDTQIIPLEASLKLSLPLFISPYAGVGAGYYVVDSDIPGYDDSAGYFGTLGLEFKILAVGAFAEVRYVDIEERFLDGTSANIGLLVKW